MVGMMGRRVPEDLGFLVGEVAFAGPALLIGGPGGHRQRRTAGSRDDMRGLRTCAEAVDVRSLSSAGCPVREAG